MNKKVKRKDKIKEMNVDEFSVTISFNERNLEKRYALERELGKMLKEEKYGQCVGGSISAIVTVKDMQSFFYIKDKTFTPAMAMIKNYLNSHPIYSNFEIKIRGFAGGN